MLFAIHSEQDRSHERGHRDSDNACGERLSVTHNEFGVVSLEYVKDLAAHPVIHWFERSGPSSGPTDVRVDSRGLGFSETLMVHVWLGPFAHILTLEGTTWPGWVGNLEKICREAIWPWGS